MPETEPLLTTPQVARMAGVSARTVHRAVYDEELSAAMQVGTGPNAPYLFERAAVERWIAERHHETEEEVSQ